jgi:hypothetical protein
MVRDKGSFLTLDHPASGSRLLVSLWREDELMNRTLCESRARLLRDLPRPGAQLLSERFVNIPEGFDTLVAASFDGAEGEPLTGRLIAFGGHARECFAFIFTTTAAGDEAEQILGDRLAMLQTLTLEGIERRGSDPIERVPAGQ